MITQSRWSADWKSCWKIQFVMHSNGIAHGSYWPSSTCSPKTYMYFCQMRSLTQYYNKWIRNNKSAVLQNLLYLIYLREDNHSNVKVMIKWLIWTIWTPMSSVLKKADKLNLSLSCFTWNHVHGHACNCMYTYIHHSSSSYSVTSGFLPDQFFNIIRI